MTTGPRLSMLWESVDPADALAARFGFADTARAVAWLRETLHDTWAIPVDSCERLVISSGNLLAWITSAGSRLIVKCSVVAELFTRLADVATLTAWLHARGLPVAAPIPAADGRLRVGLRGVSLGVIPVVEGELLDVDVPSQVEQAGRMLAALHEALADYPHPFDDGRATRTGQLVHGDFRSANVLHDGTGITAVLDFELAGHRGRAADLAKAAVMLATQYHDWGPTTPAVREAFVAAYCDRAPLTGSEQDELRRATVATLDHFGWR